MSVGLFARAPNPVAPHHPLYVPGEDGEALIASLPRSWNYLLTEILPLRMSRDPYSRADEDYGFSEAGGWPWEKLNGQCGAMHLSSFRRMWEGAPFGGDRLANGRYVERHIGISTQAALVRQRVLEFCDEAAAAGATWMSWG